MVSRSALGCAILTGFSLPHRGEGSGLGGRRKPDIVLLGAMPTVNVAICVHPYSFSPYMAAVTPFSEGNLPPVRELIPSEVIS